MLFKEVKFVLPAIEGCCNIWSDVARPIVHYLPIKDGAHSSTVGAASVDVEARCQQDAIFYRDWAMRKWGNKQLIPAWTQKESSCDFPDLSVIPFS